ncbi:outer membrane protein assembly factor BamB family protein [Rubinisphaera italica]|uniref:Outer membrane biogenesis protein BamB n=1 Tax=Rubinisphaera italica TaxID=2527969 RepID=A0A5C5XGT7_9PLAN|nr:PQQ-binding-like beta-propeller repeat protein [Rubinisphaera italica]TWT62297.1 outer membrane biogenesis protein BamB [Rubinisphaera italica]
MRTFIICTLMLFGTATVQADDWLQFRGTLNNAIVTGPQLPDSFDNISWTAPLEGRGTSSPIVVRDRVIVTGCKGPRQDRLTVTCFNTADGSQMWHREFWATGRTICHEKMSVATPTPASDSERIFAFYSSNDVACLDLEGNLLWYRGLTFDYPNVSNSLGMSSSVVVKDGTVVCMAENDTQSMTFGLNAEDGTTRWQLERPRAANWTSPAVWPGEESLVLLQSSEGVTAVEAQSGKTVWEYLDGASTIPSLTVLNGVAFVPSNGLTAIKPGVSDSTVPEIVWQGSQLNPSTVSPVVTDTQAFVINGAGVLSCADATTGERLWQCRLSGKFSATPIISGDKLYCINEQGVAQVVQLGPEEGSVINSHDFSTTILAAPAAADGAIYFRGDNQLWKVE